MTEVFSSGGGTQSAAITALIVQGKLPRPDFSAIVDTEREHPAVWEYHDAVIVPALAGIGITIHRIPKSEFAVGDLYDTAGIRLPMFTNKSGEVGKLRGFCSS